MKFLSKPTELSSSLLPGKVVSMSVGENTSAAVTGELNDNFPFSYGNTSFMSLYKL